ncbi:DUF6624 domain-containing protein [Tenacibaculum amylolyticum]|uniref:DUF6624 domain-containing protein n=1 Tax=Tenacibaculum amylolyticum TaxID=104269 RepID=UPI00389498EA
MKKLLFIIVALCSIDLVAQKKGDEYRREGELDKAIDAYKKEFRSSPENSNNTYNLACAYALQYQKDSAFHYLELALKNDTTLWALADNDLLSLSEDKRWSLIENRQLKKYQEQKGKLPKVTYAKELLRLIMKDQALDYQLDMAKLYFMKKAKVPHWYYPIAKMKEEISKGNFIKMEKLLEENGWPTYSTVGKIAADAPLLVINHHKEDEIRKKYLTRIKQACENKEGSCLEYAKIHDRILVNDGKKQLYGMQFRYNENRNLEPFPIASPEYVDKRRKTIGLEPLKQYLKRKINYNWKVEQKNK